MIKQTITLLNWFPIRDALALAKTESNFRYLNTIFILTCIVGFAEYLSRRSIRFSSDAYIYEILIWPLIHTIYPVVIVVLAIRAVSNQYLAAKPDFSSLFDICFKTFVLYFFLIFMLLYLPNKLVGESWVNLLTDDLRQHYGFLTLIALIHTAIYCFIYCISALFMGHSIIMALRNHSYGDLSLSARFKAFLGFIQARFKMVMTICLIAFTFKYAAFFSLASGWWLPFSIGLDALGSSCFVLMLISGFRQ